MTISAMTCLRNLFPGEKRPIQPFANLSSGHLAFLLFVFSAAWLPCQLPRGSLLRPPGDWQGTQKVHTQMANTQIQKDTNTKQGCLFTSVPALDLKVGHKGLLRPLVHGESRERRQIENAKHTIVGSISKACHSQPWDWLAGYIEDTKWSPGSQNLLYCCAEGSGRYRGYFTDWYEEDTATRQTRKKRWLRPASVSGGYEEGRHTANEEEIALRRHSNLPDTVWSRQAKKVSTCKSWSIWTQKHTSPPLLYCNRGQKNQFTRLNYDISTQLW